MNLRLVGVCCIVIGLLLVGFEAGSQEKAEKAAVSAKTLKPRTALFPLGAEAPNFSLQSHDGTTVTLSKFRGKKRLILAFYVGDDTWACTRQLCYFQDHYDMLTDRDTVVLGINPADAESHKAFVDKNRFPFSLLVDEDSKVAAAYGCRAPDGTNDGTVYIIGKDGKVELAKREVPEWTDLIKAIDAARSQGPPQ